MIQMADTKRAGRVTIADAAAHIKALCAEHRICWCLPWAQMKARMSATRKSGAWRKVQFTPNPSGPLSIIPPACTRSATFSASINRVTASRDKTARVWDAASGKAMAEPLRGHKATVVSAAFSADGKRIVTASVDNTARVWDAASGKAIGDPFTGHEDDVESAVFSPDGKRILTTSADNTARVWNVAVGETLDGHDGEVWSAAFSPDGKRIVTGSVDKTVRI